jgi:hypothetical protein
MLEYFENYLTTNLSAEGREHIDFTKKHKVKGLEVLGNNYSISKCWKFFLTET